MNKLGLGYLHLNKHEQTAYVLLEQSMRKYAVSCDASKIHRSVNIFKVINTVLGDNPDIIYFNKTALQTSISIMGKKLSFVGCLSRSQTEKCNNQLQKALEDAVWEIDKESKNEREILLHISEYLQRNVEYDEVEYAATRKSKHPMAHNAYGALVEHRAVCDGFASAYALIAQYFGIRGMVVSGMSSYKNSKHDNHAWNIIEYEGQFYHVDATWDSNSYADTKHYSYDYLGLDDDEISVDHDWDISTTPKCDANKLSFYRYNDLLANSESQIEDIIVRQLNRGEKVIRLKVSPTISLTNDEDQCIREYISSAFSRSKITGNTEYYYYWRTESRCIMIIIE